MTASSGLNASRAQLLFGTDEPPPAVRTLAAGPLTAELVDGNLRIIRWRGIEVLRAIAYVVRDRDWGTFAPALAGLSIEQDDAGFRVAYMSVCDGAGNRRLHCKARIEGSPDGRLSYMVDACPDGDFETNRCGFCVLHPILGLAGQPVTVEHVDGSTREARFPDAIEPWQPFQDMRAITHGVAPGVRATCRFEGDTFEMEDQRNWSDASYKTYVRPLALPWPYHLPGGVTQRQQVTLLIEDTGSAVPRGAAAREIDVVLGPSRGRMPRFGLVITPDETAAVLRAAARLREIEPQLLLLHVDPLASHGLDAIRGLAAVRRLCPDAEAVLECVVPGRGHPLDELRQVAELVRDAGLALDAIAVSPAVDRQSTPPGSAWPDCPPLEAIYAAAREAFQGLRLGGGMFSYFTELNRKRPPVDRLDFVTHCTCPIVHAADDLSVMQSLQALPAVVRSTRAIIGTGKPYRIGPSTIGMRQNPYGSRTFDNPDDRRLTMTHADPRQRGLFAAAWMVGYLAETEAGDLDAFTGGALTGALGLIPPGDGGAVYPVFHVVNGIAALAGAPRLGCRTSDPDQVLGLAAMQDGGTVLWLANITALPQVVKLPAGAWHAAVLDHNSWEHAAEGSMPAATPCGAGLTLQPYAVACLKG